MKCKKCGQDNLNNTMFCENCGARLKESHRSSEGRKIRERMQGPSMIRCANCNSYNPSDCLYCENCGKRLISQEAVEELYPGKESDRRYVGRSQEVDPEEREYGGYVPQEGKYEKYPGREGYGEYEPNQGEYEGNGRGGYLEEAPQEGGYPGYGPYGRDSYGGDPYANPYGGDPYANPYGGAPYANPYGGDPYANPYGGAPYGNPYEGDPYEEDPYGQPSYDRSFPMEGLYDKPRPLRTQKGRRGKRFPIWILLGSLVLTLGFALGILFIPKLIKNGSVSSITQVFDNLLGKKENESKPETSKKNTKKEDEEKKDEEQEGEQENEEDTSSTKEDSKKQNSPSDGAAEDAAGEASSDKKEEEENSSKDGEEPSDQNASDGTQSILNGSNSLISTGESGNTANNVRVLESVPDLSQVWKIEVVSATASSTIDQDEFDNDPMTMFDGYDDTSWQEGASGYGIGEFVTFSFAGLTKVSCLSFHLGNWQSEYYYHANSIPKTLTLVVGEETFRVSFSNEQKEYWVVFDQPIQTSQIKLIIEEVYQGTTFMDTCISEIEAYGSSQEGTVSSGPDSSSDQSLQSNGKTPFYGIWVMAESSRDMALVALQDMKDNGYWKAEILYTLDWEGLNQEPWYVLTTGRYDSEEIAREKLEDVLYEYPEAYVKYTGSYKGN